MRITKTMFLTEAARWWDTLGPRLNALQPTRECRICGVVLPPANTQGLLRQYCSARCRTRAARAKRRQGRG